MGGMGARVAVGYRPDEFPNEITKPTAASFEPVLDYVVVKFPRFAFEKFPDANAQLTTQMKSVGESMAIGRTFKEAFQKGLRALEIGRPGWSIAPRLADDRLTDDSDESLRGALRQPTPERIFQVKRGMLRGFSVAELHELTAIDPWFLDQMRELVDAERWYAELGIVDADALRRMKRFGFSDRQLAVLRGGTEDGVRNRRQARDGRPRSRTVGNPPAQVAAASPHLSTRSRTQH